MQFEPTRLPEVVLIKPRVFGDPRGFFFESWHAQKFSDDPEIGVQWPLPAGVAPTLSGKDAIAPLFKDADTFT